MKDALKNLKGQIGFLPLLGIGASFIMGMAGLVLNGFYNSGDKIEKIQTENVQTVQRVATIEEALRGLKEDNKEIKADIKIIIQKLK